jgi:predicted extracellular nuclease
MSILELVVVISAVVCVLSLILNFIMFVYINSMRVHTTQLHAGLGSMLGKILSLEQLTGKIANGMTEFINVTGELVERIDMMTGNKQPVYRTADGKYSASTLEDLINKIREDNNSDEYFSDDDIKKLRDLFEDDDDDDED